MCVDNMVSYQRHYFQFFINYSLVKKKKTNIGCVFVEDVTVRMLKHVGSVVVVFFPPPTFAHSLCCFHQLLRKNTSLRWSLMT